MKKTAVSLGVLVALAASLSAAEPIEPKERIDLFNGEDLSGWTVYLKDGAGDPGVFTVRDGLIRCTGSPAGYLRTEQDYRNYKLHLEWRWVATPGNSGVLLHMSAPDVVWPKSIECQLMSGNAGDFFVIGGSSEKPAGEWNVYEIVCKDDGIYPVVNGELKNVGTDASVSAGKICVQSEGAPIEFRNIYLVPLD